MPNTLARGVCTSPPTDGAIHTRKQGRVLGLFETRVDFSFSPAKGQVTFQIKNLNLLHAK